MYIYVVIFAGTGSGLHCPKILISTYASRVKFHKSPFWVLILAGRGPYWVSILPPSLSGFHSRHPIELYDALTDGL